LGTTCGNLKWVEGLFDELREKERSMKGLEGLEKIGGRVKEAEALFRLSFVCLVDMCTCIATL
jgi:hypothetical protein